MKVLDYAGLTRFKSKLETIFAPISHTHNNKADLVNGEVPVSELPSSAINVLEYNSSSAFPATGEAQKLYVAKDTNRVSRWNGSAYVEISSSVELGETSTTAYRGDRGKIAYDHAILKGVASALGLYKIQSNSEGHVVDTVPVQLSDLTNMGVAAESELTDLYRQFWNDTDEMEIPLNEDGKVYLAICTPNGAEYTIMNAQYGAIILIVNGRYGAIHQGSDISISVNSNVLTVSTEYNIRMALVEL